MTIKNEPANYALSNAYYVKYALQTHAYWQILNYEYKQPLLILTDICMVFRCDTGVDKVMRSIYLFWSLHVYRRPFLQPSRLLTRPTHIGFLPTLFEYERKYLFTNPGSPLTCLTWFQSFINSTSKDVDKLSKIVLVLLFFALMFWIFLFSKDSYFHQR